MDDKNTSNGSKRIYLFIIAILLLINGFACYLLYNANKMKEAKITEVEKQKVDITGLKAELTAASLSLDSLKGKNAELDSIILERQSLIERTKVELIAAQKRGTLTPEQVKKYEEIIAKYKGDNEELRKKIDELTAQNQSLTAQNLQVTKSLEDEKTKTEALVQDNKHLSDEKEVLSKKVELGALLHLQNFVVTGEKKKKSGKEIAEKKAKNMDYLKIVFETGENQVLEKGPVSLYLRLISPKGETIALADQGSGTLKLAEGKGDVQYTRKVDIDWAQANQKLDININLAQNIREKGTFKVEVYQSGYMIGSGSETFK